MLIQKGYLERSIWQNSSPTYYIEVKTTLKDLNRPFFCSQTQYELMNDMILPGTLDQDEIYLIARVFKLGTGGMGLRLYVDPAGLHIEGELLFKSDGYAVSPHIKCYGHKAQWNDCSK
jgi:hypothetical protein